MTLASQMLSDITTVFLQTDEHAVTRNYKDGNGHKGSMSVIIENHSVATDSYEGGTKKYHKAILGVASTYDVDETWTFDVDDDGRYWVFDPESSIQNDQCGWLWVPVTIATQEEAASREYRRR